MPDSEINLTLEEALETLKEYSCMEVKPVESETEKQRLRQAILLICSLCEYENLGICADSAEAGIAALNSYLAAMGYNFQLTSETVSNDGTPVYLKFNTQKQSHYLDSYPGTYRGVLISCQTEDDRLSGTYGHFPLDLFE
jgi:hypothetical protein